jgi:hypothetical protein
MQQRVYKRFITILSKKRKAARYSCFAKSSKSEGNENATLDTLCVIFKMKIYHFCPGNEVTVSAHFEMLISF